MAIRPKLLEKLRTLITMPRHKPKVMAPEGMQWEPMGIEPLMDIDGTGRNFCTAPRDVHFNTARQDQSVAGSIQQSARRYRSVVRRDERSERHTRPHLWFAKCAATDHRPR